MGYLSRRDDDEGQTKPLLGPKRSKGSERTSKGSVVTRAVLTTVGVTSVVLLAAGAIVGHHHHHKHHKKHHDNEDPVGKPRLGKYRYGWGGDAANLTVALSLCSEFDDDGNYPSELCDCGDFRTQCMGNMQRSQRYHDLCSVACPSEGAVDDNKCPGLTEPSWGVPCAWQAIVQLPETCEGRFKPVTPFGTSRNLPNKFSPTKDYLLGYTSTFAGPCNAHAFCFSCLDPTFRSGIHPHCNAVFHAYGATPEATGSQEIIDNFFDDLDSFWCHDDVLTDLAHFFNEESLLDGGVPGAGGGESLNGSPE